METKWMYPTMDEWQKQVLLWIGNLILMCGRQVGKSEIMAKKIADYLLNNPKVNLMIVSGVERQASGLYNKVLRLLEQVPGALKTGKDKPLRTSLRLRNGSTLITEPVGTSGAGARQHALHGVIFEEMQLIPEDAFGAITPMLFTTGGFIWMLGTAWATEGYVYERLSDPNFKVFMINSEEVAEKRPEPHRTIMLNYLEQEKVRLPEGMYAQEYLAIPSSKVRQIFPDELIKECCILSRPNGRTGADYICGLDPAGLGDDEGSISIFTYDEDNGKMKQVEHEITTKLKTTETTDRIISLERMYNFVKIYVDDGGLGFGVWSELLKEDDTKFKTIALNNSSRPLDYKDEKQKKILGDEMIYNLHYLMQKGQIKFLADAEIRESLKSYKFEKNLETKKITIASNYNHPVQSIMRAAWHAQNKDLNLAVYSIKI
jgi:hypothetical protein